MSGVAEWAGLLEISGSPVPPSNFSWTTIPTLNALDRNIYVSVAGNDSNDGLTTATPKRTVGAAKALLRNGFGDRLLMRCGDTFNTAGTENFSGFRSYGASADRPTIISSYGTGARPILDCQTSTGFSIGYPDHTVYPTWDGTLGNIWIVGIEITSSTFNGSTDGPDGINVAWPMTNMLVEDCYIHNVGYGVVWSAYSDNRNWSANPRHTNMRLRGCVIADTYRNNQGDNNYPNNQGLYASNCDTLLVEQNIFDRNGWNVLVSGSGDNGRRRQVYIQGGNTVMVWITDTQPGPDNGGCTDVSVINNIGAGTDGFQVRSGGTITGNVISRCKTGLHAGVVEPMDIQMTMDGNVILEGVLGPGFSEAINAVSFGQIASPSSFSNNIISGTLETEGTDDLRGVWIRKTGSRPVITSALTMANNIMYHCGSFDVSGSAGADFTGTITYNDNDWQATDALYNQYNFGGFTSAQLSAVMSGDDNSWNVGAGTPENQWFIVGAPPGNGYTVAGFSAIIGDGTGSNVAVSYADPNRTLGTYYLSIGGTNDHNAFMTACRSQSKANWNNAYTAQEIITYIRAGFV